MATFYQLTEWPLAATDMFERYATELSTKLTNRFARTDPQKIYDAVLEAILDISLKLDRLDDLDDLGGLLSVAALRKLQGFYRSDEARRLREQEKGFEFVAKTLNRASDVGEQISNAELLDRIIRELAIDDVERTILKHWGESTEELAQVLGWQTLSAEEQRKRIKPIRDRLTQRLKRFLDEKD